MDKSEKVKLITKVARFYYIENLIQEEIADKLNISRTKVSRYLDKARKQNIVEIKINAPSEEDFSELEYKMEKKYMLKECTIVPTSENNQDILREMGIALGSLFERILNDGDYIGIGWGSTLKYVADYLNVDKKIDVKVVPMIGGLGKVGTGFHTNSVAKIIAEKLGGISYVINSPAVLDSKEFKKIIEKDSNSREILEMSKMLKVAVVGMGTMSADSTLIKSGSFTIEEFDYLSNLGIVGDVNLIFINRSGEFIDNEIAERILTLPLEKIKKIRNVIGIGFGDKKLNVILGALRGKLINILISDQNTVLNILKEDQS
jgi:DNA-binding transcriptional regulator LsrR (DeoR family)